MRTALTKFVDSCKELARTCSPDSFKIEVIFHETGPKNSGRFHLIFQPVTGYKCLLSINGAFGDTNFTLGIPEIPRNYNGPYVDGARMDRMMGEIREKLRETAVAHHRTLTTQPAKA